MRKTKIRLLTAALLAFLLLSTASSPVFAASANVALPELPSGSGMRGIWVASVLNIDYPKTVSTNPELLKSEAIQILDTVQASGLNAVFLQVRPTADAFYPSRIFPWSRYLTGTQGLAPQNGFDPLQFWIEEAHQRGLELHAWLNPYRITRKTADEPPHDISSLTSTHPARLHPEWVVAHADGNLYFDPGHPEVRRMLIDSVMELVDHYPVDGIHFDDYFYPGKDFNDAHTYARYGQGFASLEDWRRENVNILIRELNRTLKTSSPHVRFGISPFGIWANQSSHPQGSATRGNQTYYAHYADPLTWIREGSIDYIAPQIYWHIGFDIADYRVLLEWWHKAVQGSSVELYIGQAAYRTENPDPESPWFGVMEIERQLRLNEGYPGVAGSIFFNYSSLARSPALQELLQRRFGGGLPQPRIGSGDKRSLISSLRNTPAHSYLGRLLQVAFPKQMEWLQLVS